MSVSGLASTAAAVISVTRVSATAAFSATKTAAIKLKTVSSDLLNKALSHVSKLFKAVGTLLFTKAGAGVALAALAVIGVAALLHYKFSILTPATKGVPSTNAVSSVFKRAVLFVKEGASRMLFPNRQAHPLHQQQIEKGLRDLPPSSASSVAPFDIPSSALSEYV